MFVIGALPAFLVIYIRTQVDESPAWLQGRVRGSGEESGKRLGKTLCRTPVSLRFMSC